MKHILFLSTLLSLTGITIQAEGIKDVDCKVFSKLITSPEIQLVDCRTPEEFAEGHINGAILIDYKAADFKNVALERLAPEKKVAIYCRSGRRSRAAAEILAAEGYTLFNLQGGIISWKEEGYPIETNESNTMERKTSPTILSITNTSSSGKLSATPSRTGNSLSSHPTMAGAVTYQE